MFRWQRHHLVLSVYGLLGSTSAFIMALVVFQTPSDSTNTIFLGLSLPRLAMMGGACFVGIIQAVVAVKTYRDQIWAEKVWSVILGRKILSQGIRWGALLGILFGWIICFTPLYRWGNYQDYYLRAFPLVIWCVFICILTFTVSGIEKYGFHLQSFLEVLSAQKNTLKIALILLTILFLVWALIAVTGMGLWVSDGYWYGAGVPILSLQILIALVVGLGVYFLEKSRLSIYIPLRLDILIFILVWGLTAFFWVREPLPRSFFAPGPYPPDYQYYPYSDAAIFDLGSQFALIGQGINNGVFFDRVLYTAFLIFLHKFAGQDYLQVVALQAAIYAVFPAILYLLGKAIHGRAFGIILAILVLLRGMNGIAASTMIDLANQKQMLTDFPTVIFMAWFTLMLVRWLKNPGKNYLYVVWAGGVVGLAIMLRTNTLFLVLLAALLIGIVYWHQKLRGTLVGILVVVTMFASTFAWGAYNNKSIFDIYIYRMFLVIRARYPHSALPIPQEKESKESNEENPIKYISLHQDNGALSSFEVRTQLESRIPSSIQMLSPVLLSINAQGAASELKPIPIFVTIHFLHNMIASIFILPTSAIFHDLSHTVKEVNPYWASYWDGSFTANAHFFLIINLFLIALGIGVSWKSATLAGLVPLGAFLFYNLANAFARTSGGRYVVPMDWIVLFYYALGLFQMILWGMSLFGLESDAVQTVNDLGENERIFWTWKPLKKAPFIMLFFLFIGGLIPLSEQFFPRRYPAQTPKELLVLLEKRGDLHEMGFNAATLKAVSVQWPNFRVITGRLLYPRYFVENQGVPKNRYPYNAMGFPRIAFTMIGSEGLSNVILPHGQVLYFPNASDVIVLGCQGESYIDALAVVVAEDQKVVYVRQPASPLRCPLQQPVCNENHVCQ